VSGNRSLFAYNYVFSLPELSVLRICHKFQVVCILNLLCRTDLTNICSQYRGRNNVVGIATGYGPDGSGLGTSVGARSVLFSTPISTFHEIHPASCTMGTGFLSRRKSGRGVALTIHPRLASRLGMSRAISLLPVCVSHGMLRSGLNLFLCVLNVIVIITRYEGSIRVYRIHLRLLVV
jgi:hypothetical protein